MATRSSAPQSRICGTAQSAPYELLRSFGGNLPWNSIDRPFGVQPELDLTARSVRIILFAMQVPGKQSVFGAVIRKAMSAVNSGGGNVKFPGSRI